MAEGWIKAWRKMLDNEVLQHETRLSLFARLLLKASHKPTQVFFKGRFMTIGIGQCIISERDEAAALQCTRKKIRSALNVLQNADMVARDGAQGISLVTVRNYSFYQSSAELEGPAQGPRRGPEGAQQGPTEQEGEEGKKERKSRGAHPRANGDARGTRLPPDWQPSEGDKEFARSLGLNPNWVAEKFRDHWLGKAGAAGRKVDWPATWRNWCRTEAERLGSKPQRRGQHRRQATDLLNDLERVGGDDE